MTAADDKLDNKIGGWIADWPVAERPEQAWDEMSERIAARTARTKPGTAQDEWFTAPCPREPEEGTSDPARASGGHRMSEDTDKPNSEEAPAPPAEPKKSLKEIAKRISIPPPPMPAGDAAPAAAASAATGTPLPVTRRPVEAKDGDSGVVNLQAVREQATSIPDTGAQPATSGLFDEDDDKKPAAAAAARPAARKSSLTPLIAGSVVALTAIAAVAVFAVRGRGQEAAPPPAAMAASAPAQAQPQEMASAAPAASAEAPAASASAEVTASGALAHNDPRAAPGEAKASTAKTEEAKDKSAAPAATGDPNSLQAQMDKAVGGSTPAPKADEPAAKAPHSADVPEVPSQGAIQGAMGAVMGQARSCVAGMDEPSRAQVTFVSNGSVSAVSVSGPAAGKPAAGCISAALKRAKVTPFQKPSFSVGVTIRP